MPFRFSLESVLRLRKNLEHAEELVLNKILQEIASAQLELQRIAEEHQSFRAQRDRNLTKGLPGAYLKEITEKEQYLELAAKRLQTKLRDLENKRTAQLVVLRNAQQNREVLEEIRDQKHSAYQIEQTRREQKSLDDLFLSRIKSDD